MTPFPDLPDDLRRQVDDALINPRPPLGSCRLIHKHFRLRHRFGLSLAQFRRHARCLRWRRALARHRDVVAHLSPTPEPGDPHRFAQTGALALLHTMLSLYLAPPSPSGSDLGPGRQAADLLAAYKAWMQARPAVSDAPASTGPDAQGPDYRKPFPPELMRKIRTEIYGLDYD